MYRLVNMRTHQRSGDMAIVKMFEVGNKRTGDIQTAKVTNNQTGVVVAPGGTMREVYKSKWLRDKEGALAAEFEAEANNGTMKTSRRNSN
jgi:hypothetical protein